MLQVPVDENTTEGALPATVAHAFGRGPMAYVAAFLGGFVVFLGLGAAAMWGGPDIEALINEGKVDQALLLLDREAEPSPKQLRLKGHALYLKGLYEPMLIAYQGAVAGGAVDAEALKHTLEALGKDRAASLAVKTLEDWPGDDVNPKLLELTSDQITLRRKRAMELLEIRKSATAPMRLQGKVNVANADVKSEHCQTMLGGVKTLYALTDQPQAAAMLRASKSWRTVLDIDNSVVYDRHRCLPENLVKRTLTSLSPIDQGG